MIQEVVGKGWQTFISHTETKGLLEYPAFDGHPGSSETNWVPIDLIRYQLAKRLGIEDKKIEK